MRVFSTLMSGPQIKILSNCFLSTVGAVYLVRSETGYLKDHVMAKYGTFSEIT